MVASSRILSILRSGLAQADHPVRGKYRPKMEKDMDLDDAYANAAHIPGQRPIRRAGAPRPRPIASGWRLRARRGWG
ncbi:hypothetical protein KU6B_52800 [Mameliella alba]|nr:hypothetical protein KU6B_52800 [Mameliella alba]